MEGSTDAQTYFTAEGCTLVGFLLSIGVLLTTAGLAVRSMGLFRALLWRTMREGMQGASWSMRGLSQSGGAPWSMRGMVILLSFNGLTSVECQTPPPPSPPSPSPPPQPPPPLSTRPPPPPSSTILVRDDFSTDGNLVGSTPDVGGVWAAQTDGAGSGAVTVSQGAITVSSASAEDVYSNFTAAVSTVSVYAGTDINHATPSSLGIVHDSAFTHFNSFTASLTTSTTCLVRPTGHTSTGYKLRLGQSTTAEMAYGTTYRLVYSFDTVTDRCSLWVHPTLETSTRIMTANAATADTTISAVAFRQTNSTPPWTLSIRNFIVATDFAEACPPPPPSPCRNWTNLTKSIFKEHDLSASAAKSKRSERCAELLNSSALFPRRLTACVIAGCVGHASVHCDSGPRAWGSGDHARCVEQQQQQLFFRFGFVRVLFANQVRPTVPRAPLRGVEGVDLRPA
jgi:hypothetical protein